MELEPSSETIGWYPNPPNMEVDGRLTVDLNLLKNLTIKCASSSSQFNDDSITSINWDHRIKYTPMIVWAGDIKKCKKEACRRHVIKGIEVRDLGSDHFLCGEKGVFATEKFSQFDVVGEYTGRVVDDTVNGHYVAALEDKTLNDSLGVDASECGNEMRYINSYLNIDFEPNVTMRTAYINSYPHIIIICTRSIEPGEELLLDYGKAYTDAYLRPKPKVGGETIPMARVRDELPGMASDSSSESDMDECGESTVR